jgi:hypothetical protein
MVIGYVIWMRAVPVLPVQAVAITVSLVSSVDTIVQHRYRAVVSQIVYFHRYGMEHLVSIEYMETVEQQMENHHTP